MKIEFVPPSLVLNNYQLTMTPSEFEELRSILVYVFNGAPDVCGTYAQKALRFIKEFDCAPTER